MKTIALIPARGGSKGIPKKNIKSLAGKPLIAWSIEQAKKSYQIDDIYVSTDCEEIASIAKKHNAKVPFLRPAELSSDEASTESVMIHFCEYLNSHNIDYDNLLLIQATSPIRAPIRFDDALTFFNEGNYDSLVTATPSHRFFWKNPEAPKSDYDIFNRPRRQDIKEEDRTYMETGSFYITTRKSFNKYKNRLCGKVGVYITPESESYEIDSQLDFDICESILKKSMDTNHVF